MARQAITIRTIESARPCPGRDVYTWDSSLKGFGFRITPRGVKSYVLQYRVNGYQARRTTIGIHGSPWTTHTARKEAERLLMLVRQGVDPVEQAREAKRQGAKFLRLLRPVRRALFTVQLERQLDRVRAHS